MAEKPKTARPRSNVQARGKCACGKVTFEIDVPAVWAWHDHGAASRRAQGAAYATYVGSWKSRYRLKTGANNITHFEEPNGAVRGFCKTCGTPVSYVRKRAPKMINIPRALFETRTGREPIYHLAIEEMQDWTYVGAKLKPLKGFPGVVWEGAQRKRRPPMSDLPLLNSEGD